MKKWIVVGSLIFLVACSVAVSRGGAGVRYPAHLRTLEDSLRFLYSQAPAVWPRPGVDSGVPWQELGALPKGPLHDRLETLKDKIELGKMLFFEPRLSGSGRISCASCHLPELSWTDGRAKSLGHEDQVSKRNAPTILNTWFYRSLFWDGRSNSLEDQAFSPINSESEMHSSMAATTRSLRGIPGYRELFQKAFGSPEISPETVTEAIAVFERTLVSRPSAFDRFLGGDTAAMSGAALKGLHLFRTKAGCMNCHHGSMFSDNGFHNTGLSDYGTKGEDIGRYRVTHLPEDMGRFKTPSLRDVMRTRPWMHNGAFNDMAAVIERYNGGAPGPQARAEQLTDPLFPKMDRSIRPLHLTKEEQASLIAFLESISSAPPEVKMPVLPGR